MVSIKVEKKKRIIIGVLVGLAAILIGFLIYWFGFNKGKDEGGGGGAGNNVPRPPDNADDLSLINLGSVAADCVNNIQNNIDLDAARFKGLLEESGELGDVREADILNVCNQTLAGGWVVNDSFIAMVNEVSGQSLPVFPSSESLVVAIAEPVDVIDLNEITENLFKILIGAGFASIVRIEPEPAGLFPNGVSFITFVSIDRFWYINEVAKTGDSIFTDSSAQIIPPVNAFIRNNNISGNVANICSF